jgi:uncharacterized membrane protein YbhN (UPF0104 family)
MKNAREFIWPLIGLAAVVVSGWLLYRELRGLSLSDVWASLNSIPPHRYVFAIASTLIAYAALAWYDRIALLHLGVHHISRCRTISVPRSSRARSSATEPIRRRG